MPVKVSDFAGNQTLMPMALPDVVIYKTKADYRHFVPLLMNEGRTEIVWFPAPGDLLLNNVPAMPVELKNGYLLDTSGINKNVVFTNYTYEEYSALPEAPSLVELKSRITDRFPLLEMYRCKPDCECRTSLEKCLELIDSGFEGCEKEFFIPVVKIEMNF